MMNHHNETRRTTRNIVASALLFCLSISSASEVPILKQRVELPSRAIIQKLPSDGGEHYNRLIFETSPYLRQHATNPVDWYPWSDEAFNKARAENKPIFLSVGYSSCHWCHVMEHESFEDAEVAAILNEHFISVKVDREERPDVDTIYMSVTQLITGQGGWPNSVFLRADQKPFYAGTYFPKEDTNGRPGFKTLLLGLANSWRNDRVSVDQQAEQLAEFLREMKTEANAISPDPELAEFDPHSRALSHFQKTHDSVNGGFGDAPKFPPHGELAYLLELELEESDSASKSIVTQTLDKMALGGMRDHLGGGFHRYSTDATWFLPHFEKMLYDNAQLLRVYAIAASAYNSSDYREVCMEIAGWLNREMQHSDGGYYSALDAVTGGVEGATYLWQVEDVSTVLADAATEFCKFYQISERGNYYEEATRKYTGTNIPFLKSALPVDRADALSKSRELLMAARNKRPQPGLDDKILTSWNGLTIGALATAGRLLEEPELVAAAERAAQFITGELYREGRLLRSFREGEAHLMGYLDDYVFFADGLIDLHVATGSQQWLDQAIQLMQAVEDYFGSGDGVYYLTAVDHEELLLRTSDPYDGALPSGIGRTALVYARLDRLSPGAGYAELARKMIDTYAGAMQSSPQGTTSLLRALRMLGDGGNMESLQITASTQHLTESTVQVILHLDIKPGWHINSHAPGNTMLVPTTVVIQGDGVKITRLDYPEGTPLESPGISEVIHIYEGAVHIPLEIEFDSTRPENVLLEVTAQPCSDKLCLAPITQQVVVSLNK